MTSHFFTIKKTLKDSTPNYQQRQSGFALMVALGLMSFVLLIILGLSTLIQVNSNITSSEKDLATAKQNALFALNLAIGDLQNEMGPDQRISATASILDEFPETEAIEGVNNPYWTGAWNSNDPLAGNLVNQVVSKNRSSSDGKPSHFRRWLVSTPINYDSVSPEDLIAYAKNFSKDSKNAIIMVGSGTVGDEGTNENSVYVPRQIINKQLEEENGYAYWIGDEGVKTRVAGAKPDEIETDLEQILNVNNAGSPRLNAIDGFKDVEDISDQSAKILTIGTAQFAFKEALGGNIDAFKNKYHSLSAFSRGLMVDVKHGGIRKDLSLLFATDSLPLEYDEQPIFTYDASEGPYWNYVERYHNIYKRIQNENGRNFLNVSDFWDDAELNDDESEIKYTDLPIPVLARMQVIFSLHKSKNTYNGLWNNGLYDPYANINDDDSDSNDDDSPPSGPGPSGPGGPGPSGPGGPGPGGPGGPGNSDDDDSDSGESFQKESLFSEWEPFGGAEITEDNSLIIPNTAEDTGGFRVAGSNASSIRNRPLQFFLPGEIKLQATVAAGNTATIYFKFSQLSDFDQSNDYLTDPLIISSNKTEYTISIPEQEYELFDFVTLYIEEKDIIISLSDITIVSDEDVQSLRYDHSPSFQSNYEEILQLMMTPIFYLWNPYNVELVMDTHERNWGSYEYFFGPPDIEFTYNGDDWINLRTFGIEDRGTFQFGLGRELLAFWSSNNYNKSDGTGEAISIPAGEFKMNRIVPAVSTTTDKGGQAYTIMQFFAKSYSYNPFKEEGESKLIVNDGPPINFDPHLANWVESSDTLEVRTNNDAFVGLFSPIISHEFDSFNPSKNKHRHLKKIVKRVEFPNGLDNPPRIFNYGITDEPDSDEFNFNIKLKNQFFISRFSLGGGWSENGANYNLNADLRNHLLERRLVGALNIDNSESVTTKGYHQSQGEPVSILPNDLEYIVNPETGLWGDMRYSPKIAINVDIRGFTETETPGKHALFMDPANTYYYDNESGDTSLALSPFRIYVQNLGKDSNFIPYNDKDQLGFRTIDSDEDKDLHTIYKCVSKELPLIPLLSLTQLDHAPLGRDNDHFAYFSGRRDLGDGDHYQKKSLADKDIIFKSKRGEERPMAPSFNMAVGNSWAHPTIPLDDIVDPDSTYDGAATDRSYLLNESLFDSYFFTGLATPSGPFSDEMTEMGDLLKGWVGRENKLPNSNYLFKLPSSLSFNEVVDTLSFSNIDPANIFDKIANFIEIEGAFNINSTSVESWIAQLSSLRGKSVLYDNSDIGDYNIDNTNLENTPVLSQTIPAEKSLENTGGKIEDIIQNSWSHYRSLEDSQIVKLANEIVMQIKARGPFLSLSQFFNREISERYPYNLKGAIQTAIDESNINIESPNKSVTSALRQRFDENPGSKQWIGSSNFDSPEVFEGDANEGLPGYITQASLMRPLTPILSARSDTFVIRAYGDTKLNGETNAKVWCEAIVQRRIDLVDKNQNLFNAKYDSNDKNAFNRQFEVVSFRWLNADEI